MYLVTARTVGRGDGVLCAGLVAVFKVAASEPTVLGSGRGCLCLLLECGYETN